MKIVWFISDITAVGYRTHMSKKCCFFWVILTFVWPIRVTFVAGDSLCDLETPVSRGLCHLSIDHVSRLAKMSDLAKITKFLTNFFSVPNARGNPTRSCPCP